MSEAMALTQSFDKEFVELMEHLREVYPEEIFTLTGVSDKQLDINFMAKEFFRTSNRKGSATADHSIDPNANVSGRGVITFSYEVPKPIMKLNSLYNLWKVIKDDDGLERANTILEMEVNGTLYINDSWDIGRPYCFNYSTYDIALEGLKMGGRLTIDPPKSLFVFLRQIEQFTVYAANSTLGATGLADLLIVSSWYVDRIKETGCDHHFPVLFGKEGDAAFLDGVTLYSYVKEQLTSLIYTLNWEFRGNQSPFTNVSVYDRPFLENLVPTYVINGKAPKIETVRWVQEIFLDAMNEILGRCPVTFPVVTACFSIDSESKERKLKDEEFIKFISQVNLKYGFINVYAGETSTLSSCCRLRSNINDLGYANSFGSGSTKIGSLGVCTLNLPRLAREAKAIQCGDKGSFELFIENVNAATYLAGTVNKAKRAFIKDRIERGSLPLYTLGFMDLGRQFSTCGFTGLYEALEILGLDMANDEGLEAAKSVLGSINAMNKVLTEKWGTPHNMEQVPAESSAVKLAKKDTVLGKNPEGYTLYSNQFLPLWKEGVDILDRIRIQGELDSYCTGGAICHLNIAERIENPETMEALIHHAAEAGVVYFAVNYTLNQCEYGHMSVGHGVEKCPICGGEITGEFTRVVGFLTNTKHWNETRRAEDWPKRVFYND